MQPLIIKGQQMNPARTKATFSQPRFLTTMVSFYILSIIVLAIFPRKVVLLPMMGIIPVTILLTAFHFLLIDIIAEVYGYRTARKALYSSIYCVIALNIVVVIIDHLPAPPSSYVVSWAPIQDPLAFEYIFSQFYLFTIGHTLGTLIGDNLNIYLLSKWSFLTKGRSFWLRSIGASSIDAFLQASISITIVGWFAIKHMGILYLFKVILISFTGKVILIAILSTPAALLCAFLKKIERSDTNNLDPAYKTEVYLNPFIDKIKRPDKLDG